MEAELYENISTEGNFEIRKDIYHIVYLQKRNLAKRHFPRADRIAEFWNQNLCKCNPPQSGIAEAELRNDISLLRTRVDL